MRKTNEFKIKSESTELDKLEVNHIKRSVNFSTSIKRKSNEKDNICIAITKNSIDHAEKIKAKISLYQQNSNENKTIKLKKGLLNQDQLKASNIFSQCI